MKSFIGYHDLSVHGKVLDMLLADECDGSDALTAKEEVSGEFLNIIRCGRRHSPTFGKESFTR